MNPFMFGPNWIVEVSTRWKYKVEPFLISLELAPGVQRVTRVGDLAGTLRGLARLTWQISPQHELSLAGSSSTTGLQTFSTGNADNRYASWTLAGRWGF